MKTILVVEDDNLKMSIIYELCKKQDVGFKCFVSINPALEYFQEHQNEISGIILDLGLTTFDDSRDYDDVRGLDMVKELTRKQAKIPILINSTTIIDLPEVMKNHKNVKGQTSLSAGVLKHKEDIESFINTL